MKVIITDPISESGISFLKEADFSVVQLYNASKEDIIRACEDVDGWIIRSGTKIEKKMIKAAKKLKAIGRAGVGVDNIDIDEATKRGP